MNIGISTGCFFPLKTHLCLEKVARAGAKTTEIFFNTHSELDTEYVKVLKNTADKNGIKVISVHPYTSAIETFMFFSRNDYKLEDSVRYYEKYFQACNILGAEYVVFHGCFDTAGYMTMDRYADIMNVLAGRADKYNVHISQENVVKFKCGTRDNLRFLARNTDSNLRFVLDLKQAVRAGQDVYSLMEIMTGRISHIHISDNDLSDDSLLPGEGSFDLQYFLKKAESGYNVKNALIEVYRQNIKSEERLKKSFKYVKGLV